MHLAEAARENGLHVYAPLVGVALVAAVLADRHVLLVLGVGGVLLYSATLHTVVDALSLPDGTWDVAYGSSGALGTVVAVAVGWLGGVQAAILLAFTGWTVLDGVQNLRYGKQYTYPAATGTSIPRRLLRRILWPVLVKKRRPPPGGGL